MSMLPEVTRSGGWGLGFQAQCRAHIRAWGPCPLHLGWLRMLKPLGSPNLDLHLLRIKLGK